MFVKSTRFKQVCQLLLSLIVAKHAIYQPREFLSVWANCVLWILLAAK